MHISLRALCALICLSRATMPLTRAEKERRVTELTRALKESQAAAVFAFRTLTVADSSKLRATLRTSGSRLQVIKKRLFQRVAADVGLPTDAIVSTEDSIAVAWGNDEIAPAKALREFVKEHDGMKLTGGLLHGASLSGADVERLAALPTLLELRGQLVSVLIGPVRGFAGVLSSTLRGLPGALNAIKEKRGETPSA